MDSIPRGERDNSSFLYGYFVSNLYCIIVSTKDHTMTDVATASYPHISYQQSGFADIRIVSDNGLFPIKFIETLEDPPTAVVLSSRTLRPWLMYFSK